MAFGHRKRSVDWLKSLCGCKLQWKDCAHIEEAREEAIAQVDVQFLLRRISHLEQLNKLRISPEEENISRLTESHSIDEMRKRRLTSEYMDKIMGGRTGLTIESMAIAKEVMNNLLSGPNKDQTSSQSFLFEAVFRDGL